MRKRNRLAKRLLALGLVLCLGAFTPCAALADTVAEAEQDKQQLEQEREDLENQLSDLQQQEAEKQGEQEDLASQIQTLQEQIDSAREEINELNENINELTMKLDKSEEEMAGTIAAFKERVVALYKAGHIGTLQILLESNSFSDFSLRTELLDVMSKHDQELVDKLEQYMEDTQGERDQVEADKERVAELKKGLESDQEELDLLYQENAAAIQEIQGAQGATENALEANAQELAENEERIAALIEAQRKAEEEARQQALQQQQQQSGSPSGSGGSTSGSVSYPTGGGGVAGFDPIWPLPGVTYISAGYNGYPGHKGLDIAGPYGTPIVAACDGTVIEANNYDSWGYSWGYYVLIYHNDTYTTRYAHMSSVAVSAGQYVTAGTVIGYEGATGNVTGPHLHFEVYQNGTRVDPMLFL